MLVRCNESFCKLLGGGDVLLLCERRSGKSSVRLNPGGSWPALFRGTDRAAARLRCRARVDAWKPEVRTDLPVADMDVVVAGVQACTDALENPQNEARSNVERVTLFHF